MWPAADQSTSIQTQSALQHLVDRFREVPDFRCGNDNQIHLLVDILVSAICAVLGGANSWQAVERFVTCHEAWFRTFLELPGGVPSHDTYRRVFLLLAPEHLNSRFADWVRDISAALGLKQVAIDGKTLCGSGGGQTGLKALHMVHAFATENGITLAQQASDAKSNEITAIPELLKLLDLKGAIVSIDAAGCQKKIAEDIVEARGDYVLAVKDNQPTLHEDVKRSLGPIIAAAVLGLTPGCVRTEERNQGRLETRTCYVSTDLSGVSELALWRGLKTIGAVHSERVVNGKLQVQTRYFISSRTLSAEQMLSCVRNHWKVENQLHWVLDVVFGEDAHQLRAGHGPRNFTTMRKLAQALIKNSNPKHSIKGTREMAGWNPNILEQILHKAAGSSKNHSA